MVETPHSAQITGCISRGPAPERSLRLAARQVGQRWGSFIRPFSRKKVCSPTVNTNVHPHSRHLSVLSLRAVVISVMGCLHPPMLSAERGGTPAPLLEPRCVPAVAATATDISERRATAGEQPPPTYVRFGGQTVAIAHPPTAQGRAELAPNESDPFCAACCRHGLRPALGGPDTPENTCHPVAPRGLSPKSRRTVPSIGTTRLYQSIAACQAPC